MSLMNNLSKLNNSVIVFLESPPIKYGFLILIIINILIIKHLSTSYLKIFDDNYFKIIYAFLIAYYACFDPVYAIALTTLMIISIQELHSRNATHSILSTIPTQTHSIKNIKNINNTTISSVNSYDRSINRHDNISNSNFNVKEYTIPDKITAKIFDNDELVYELINEHSLQKKPDSNDKLTAEYELCQEPAYKTITDNITESSKNDNRYQTMNQSINDIQSNQGISEDQNNSIQGIKGDIFNIQGLPNGFDIKNKNISNIY